MATTPTSPSQTRLVSPLAGRSEVLARHGMACTSQPLATRIAVRILEQGGSAVDAAIAANAALCLMEPTGCGLGGDLFAIVWDAKGKRLHGYNGSGRSPKGLTLERLRKELAKAGLERIPALGPLPVSVPGCVDGWLALHERFGKLPLADVLAPAIRYAEEGFPVSELIAYYWELNARLLRRYPRFSEVFEPGGRAPAKGDVFRNPQLARTLGGIAAHGRAAFYEGEVAATIARAVAEAGGFLTADDLAAHHGEWVQPVSVTYRGHEVWELPPNGQGLAALQMLRILEGYDLRPVERGTPRWLHLLTEAKKLAFEDRARYYADPAFADVPVEGLLSEAYAARRGALIREDAVLDHCEAGDPRLRDGDTVYLCTADDDGNMVSWIQSNFRGMGSGIVPEGLGFVLQDRGELFALEDGHANVYAPGKRPFHTIIPAFVTRDGAPLLAFGVMGGDMQPQGHVQILVNLLDFGCNLQEAGDLPRLRHIGSSEPTGIPHEGAGKVLLEPGFAPGVIERLRALGHVVRVTSGGFGGYQAIMRDAGRGVWIGASEARKDGCALGY
ncbi:MAG: gamma-glutamyltransferase [Planctomycetota bacterium]